MAVITRTITNNLSTNLDLFVPGYNTIKPQVVIAPSATVDLFTVITGDELEAIQNQLALLVANSSITVNATADTTTFNPIGGAADLTLTHNHIFVGNGSNIATDTALGVDTEVIFNSSGALTGSLNLAWDHTNTRLILGAPASPATTAFKLEAYDNTNVSCIALTGKAVDASTSTDGGMFYLFHNGTNNRQVAFGDTLAGQTNSTDVVIFSLTPGPGIHAAQAGGGSGVVLSLGSAAAGLNITGSTVVAVGGGTVGASAVFDVQSTTQGFLPPRMTQVQKEAISSPAIGLVVYDTTLTALCVYTGAGSDMGWATVTAA